MCDWLACKLPMLVAPFAGAWIEILCCSGVLKWITVAPFAGAWIEIMSPLPVGVEGGVAPFAGAWIEIQYLYQHQALLDRRTLRGCVD